MKRIAKRGIVLASEKMVRELLKELCIFFNAALHG
jgi:hypothetical protein